MTRPRPNQRRPPAALHARRLLQAVLREHATLAVQLLGHIQRLRTDDPKHRFQIAAIVVFLAGVDKALSLALELLYLAGKVDWHWLKPRYPESGIVACGPGLTPKLRKLKQLGLDLTGLLWLVDLRNRYIHECGIYAGYTISPVWTGTPRLRLRPRGPEIHHSGAPLATVAAADLRTWSNELARRLGKFLDKSGWRLAWRKVAGRVARLPKDPQPYYRRLANARDEEFDEIVRTLNKQHIGEGLRHVLAPPHTVSRRTR